MWGSAVSLCLYWAFYLLLCLLLGLLVAFLVYCAYVKYIHMKYDHIPGPPRDSFLMGHSSSMVKAADNYKVMHDLFLRWAEEYGPVYRINILHRVILNFTGPESVKITLHTGLQGTQIQYKTNRAFMGCGGEVDSHLRSCSYKCHEAVGGYPDNMPQHPFTCGINAEYFARVEGEYLMSPSCPKDPYAYNRLFYLFGKRFLGKGLLTNPDHNQWYKQRRIMDPAFSHKYLMEMIGVFNEKAEQLMEQLVEKADGKQQVSLHAAINCVTLDVITKVAFGLELGLVEGNKTAFPNAISLALKGMVQYMKNPFMEYMPQHWSFIREVQESADLLRKTGRKCIMQRKKAMLDGEELPKDILTKILQCAEQENGLDDEIMLDNFITFFIAGQETTANQLSFTVMELTRQPEITRRLREELDEVIGFKRDISFDDVTNLTYMTQVLKESLRLYPPGPGTSRYIKDDAVIEGIRIPGGVSVNFNTYVMGRMEKFFPDPFKFDPERFHPSAPKPYYCYFPFALGPRSCLGQVFSQLEAKVVLGKFLQRFEFELVPGQSYAVMDTGTLRPRDGVVCTLRPRGVASK